VSIETAGRSAAPATPLTWQQRRFLFALALPALGLSLAYALVTTYGPVLLQDVSGPTVTGALIGTEGVLALFVPLLVGGASDRLQTRLGGRLPFILAGAALAALSLVLLPLGPDSLLWVGLCLGAFFVSYFVYYVPYNALYPDLVPREALGRSQGFQGSFRSIGMMVAMTLGGVWLAVWRPLPFLLGALVVVAMTVALFALVRRQEVEEHHHLQQHRGVRDALLMARNDDRVRRWMIANTCWEAALGSLRTFVVLYFTVGLGLSLHQELRTQGARNIHVSTVLPFAADTPWFDHAAHYNGRAPRMVLMDPANKVVDAIVGAIARPRKRISVGFKAKLAVASHRLLPGPSQHLAGSVMHRIQEEIAPPAPDSAGALYVPVPQGIGVDGRVRERMKRERRSSQVPNAADAVAD